jgi:hypothetical protein
VFSSKYTPNKKIVYRNTTLAQIKKMMSELDIRMNDEYKIVADYDIKNDKVAILLHPDKESYASFIVIKWQQKLEEYN